MSNLSKKLREFFIVVLLTAFIVAFFVKEQYSYALLTLFLFIFAQNPSIKKMWFKIPWLNMGMEREEAHIATLLGVHHEQIHYERIAIEPHGKLTIGMNISNTNIRTRFIADIKNAFEEDSTIELLIEGQRANTILISKYITGQLEDTTQNELKLPAGIDSVTMEVRMRNKGETKIFGRILIPLF